MGKFKVGDLVITNTNADDAFRKGAIGRITHIDALDDVPYKVLFISGWVGDDECYAKETELDAFSGETPADLAAARERIAALELVNTQQALLIESLQAQVAAYRVEIASRARVIDGEDLA